MPADDVKDAPADTRDVVSESHVLPNDLVAVHGLCPKLRPDQAAAFLGTASSTLAKWRLRGHGPPYFKLGTRMVVYDVEDLEVWLATRRRQSTSEGEED